MAHARSPNRQPTRSRVRAGKACTRCHERRIKCDAMQHMPCTHCVRGRHADCVLRETKRGTYTRSALRQKIGRDDPCAGAPAGVAGDLPPQCLTYRMAAEDSGALPAPGSDVAAPLTTGSSAPECTAWSSGGICHAHLQTGVEPSSIHAQEAPPESESPYTQVSSGTPGDGSSYQHISWSAMFDHFLNNRENRRDWIDKCSITYLGESFPLAIVLGGLKDGSRPKLHHLGPPFPGAQGNDPFQSQPAHMLPEDLEYLRAKGVFSLPEKAHLDALMSVFLDHVYPLYPIFNRQEFIQQYKNDHLSLILTYAISFIAVTFASQSVLSLLGFHSRHEARSFFYKKAKALFDMGYETDKITILQSTFLLSFYGGGPNTYWNFYSWVSTAVTIAEAIGIHRSTIAIPNMQPQDKSLMRRLWWALVVRDSICGTLVGRPFRIDLDQGRCRYVDNRGFRARCYGSRLSGEPLCSSICTVPDRDREAFTNHARDHYQPVPPWKTASEVRISLCKIDPLESRPGFYVNLGRRRAGSLEPVFHVPVRPIQPPSDLDLSRPHTRRRYMSPRRA